jgi:hypothetical protein
MSLRTAQPACAPQPARRHVIAAAKAKGQKAYTDVPPNVAEARAWIAAWRARQQQPASAAASGNGTSKAAAAAPKAAQRGSKFGASASFSDGTLVFTADQLQSVDYSDVKLKAK